MDNPRLNPDVLLSPVENGYIAYDAALDRLHELNPVAALIAERCDGARDIAEIRSLAAPFVPEDRTAEIGKWIEGAVEAGLLVRGGDSQAHGTVMDVASLSDLSAHLRE